MRVILRPINRHTWSNVVKFRNCWDKLQPYYTRSGNIYTGVGAESADRLGKLIGKSLSPGSTFWDTFAVRIGASDLYLDTEDPLDEIKYLFLKNHKRVKTSIFERKATADYLLINREEEAKKENLLNKAKIDSISEFKKMSISDMRKCLRLFGQNADNANSELVENSLFKIIESSPEQFLSKWTHNKNREVEVIIEQAIAKNIIRRNKNVYRFGGDTIAYSMQECIDFLNNPKNQDTKLAVLSAIDAKDYIAEPEFTPPTEEKEVVQQAKTTNKKPRLLKGLPGEDDEGIDICSITPTSDLN